MEKISQSAGECWKRILNEPAAGRALLPEIERFARENTRPAAIAFGTSGWRGETGTDFTFRNLRCVAAAIADILGSNDPLVAAALGIEGTDGTGRRGVVVGHDNRFLGPEFAAEVIGVLAARGVMAYYAGEATTPELSAAIDRLGAACCVNLTPSHNPANWSGLKFNPRDGGPAGPEITGPIADAANRFAADPSFSCASREPTGRSVDPVGLYREFLAARGLIDLVAIRRFLLTEDVLVVVDHVHGATRGRPEVLLGQGPWLQTLRTESDPLFGGVAPEPSADNMAGVMNALAVSEKRFKLGVVMDPD